jgi:hypothetical protein
MGWYAEDPFENADDLKGALKRAIEQVNKVNPASSTPSATAEITGKFYKHSSPAP